MGVIAAQPFSGWHQDRVPVHQDGVNRAGGCAVARAVCWLNGAAFRALDGILISERANLSVP
jgi:hypothetical protein